MSGHTAPTQRSILVYIGALAQQNRYFKARHLYAHTCGLSPLDGVRLYANVVVCRSAGR